MDLTGKTVVLYDGICGLCNRLVRFLIRFDRRERFRFAPLQSDFARRALEKHGINPADLDSVSVIARFGEPNESAYSKSDAIVQSARDLGGIWRLGVLYGLLPRALRDWTYDVVARHRYQVFGRYDSCPLPTPELRSKFLE